MFKIKSFENCHNSPFVLTPHNRIKSRTPESSRQSSSLHGHVSDGLRPAARGSNLEKREGRRNEVETLHKSNLPPKAAPPRSRSVAPSWSRAARCERRWLRGRSTTTTARTETKGREPRDADNAAQPNARLFALPPLSLLPKDLSFVSPKEGTFSLPI